MDLDPMIEVDRHSPCNPQRADLVECFNAVLVCPRKNEYKALLKMNFY